MFTSGTFGIFYIGRGVCLLLALSVSTHCGASNITTNSNGSLANNNASPAKSDEVLNYLDLKNSILTQEVEPGRQEVERAKFVRVEVVEVVNPGKHSLKFEVRYQPSSSNEKIYLGSFSLFPADNPGKFIVATQGKIKADGKILLSLVTPDKVDATDPLRVGIKKIEFVAE
ncbi:MAG TPA: hypothetical protein VLL54_15070 [Pyrinomonadaceae bacterium]|nr:hypothetical protein [Pyrinomonadaceae bacterium]